ncbi:mycofactocin-coupled SDR family oxidoreductase [Mycolicibacterium sp. 120266]|uniref:mycofactocin-coupled SDR family oxidoreductase n=1 Tax=Mycolicibacterium sp. 120266 TaxID=3090601 RepID=UPI00299DBA03|nr:mycofactocin-coupled SDR family oxidoreductase [Mycolicibacterium sp. 120266]MDX1875207.1 mycofactocin-coupled SDR family oxidoreductase [Mycolicibacterium sp. 120266]
MSRLQGKVALITGAARGQGRSHALRLADEGAHIIALDVCAQIGTVPYPMSDSDDLVTTVDLVKSRGRRVFAAEVDVRDLAGLEKAVQEGVSELGRLDVVVANAGTLNDTAPLWELSEEQFQDQIDVNLTGVWKTIKATVPTLLAQNEGGAVILISSISGLTVELNVGHYAASKHGVNGLMRTLSGELAPYGIRVNSINPTNVNTLMINNPRYNRLFAGGVEGATQEQALPALTAMHALAIPFLDPVDVSNAVVYLAGEDGRYITGTTLVIDAGAMNPFKAPHRCTG